jgi:hypothetical protein
MLVFYLYSVTQQVTAFHDCIPTEQFSVEESKKKHIIVCVVVAQVYKMVH